MEIRYRRVRRDATEIMKEGGANEQGITNSFHLCGWIFQLIALVSFDKGIIMPFDRMICSQQNTCTIRIITL